MASFLRVSFRCLNFGRARGIFVPSLPFDVTVAHKVPSLVQFKFQGVQQRYSTDVVSKRKLFKAVPRDEALMKRIKLFQLGRGNTEKVHRGRALKPKSTKPPVRSNPSSAAPSGSSTNAVSPNVLTKDEILSQRLSQLFNKLKFFASATTPKSFPEANGIPEIAFAGRSNVGKSTLLNQISRSAPARVSNEPGFTRSLNFYAMGAIGGRGKTGKKTPTSTSTTSPTSTTSTTSTTTRKTKTKTETSASGTPQITMVDMPGYGFATASHAEVMGWQVTMQEYIESRSSLKRLFLLIDGRHGLKYIDIEFMEYLDKIGRRYSCVLTKCDLVTTEDLARRVFIIEQRLQQSRRGTHEVFMVSERSPMAIEHFQKAILQLATSQED